MERDQAIGILNLKTYPARIWIVRHVGNKLHLLALGVVLALAAFFRFWAAPLSTGPDVAQFWAFAQVFQLHGLDFYRYANASIDIFPFEHWGFVYPPVWLLILRLSESRYPRR